MYQIVDVLQFCQLSIDQGKCQYYGEYRSFSQLDEEDGSVWGIRGEG